MGTQQSQPPARQLRGPRSRLLSSYRALVRPIEWVPRWLERYGDPIRVPTLGGDYVITADPALVKQLLSTPSQDYRRFSLPTTEKLFGETSVTQLSGHAHTRRRRLLMPPFHGHRMRAFAEAMARVAHGALDQAADQEQVSFYDVTQSIALDVILRTVFGVQSDESMTVFKRAVGSMADSLSPALLAMPALHRNFWGFGPFARYTRALEHLHGLLQGQIDAARGGADHHDVLGMLLEARHEDGSAMGDLEVREELIGLLFAGHETTATALCWAVDAIGRRPEVRARLDEELETLGPEPEPEAFTRLEYLDAVIKESMRHRATLATIVRVLDAPMELGGHPLEPGAVVAVDVAAVHRRQELYPEPERFDPERFLGRKFAPSEYLPFGGGHRRCIGAAFAGFEMQIVLGVLFTHFGVELLCSTPPRPVRRNVTFVPHDGMPVSIRAGSSKDDAAALPT